MRLCPTMWLVQRSTWPRLPAAFVTGQTLVVDGGKQFI